MGRERERAKEEFWGYLYEKVKREYSYQAIQGINKLTSLYLLAAEQEEVKLKKIVDNSLVRVHVGKLTEELIKYRDNSGYFIEYDMDDIREILPLCREQLQTVSYIGNVEMFKPLLELGVKGVDRIVPVGKTMDFDFIWDGYDLVERLSRIRFVI